MKRTEEQRLKHNQEERDRQRNRTPEQRAHYNEVVRNWKKRTGRYTYAFVKAQGYERTKKGFLMRLYRNMKSRVTGVQRQKFHLYAGCQLLPKEEFYRWALESPKFHQLFSDWELNSYDRKLTPSVDRVDSDIGYVLENMEWVTHSENSRRGTLNKYYGDWRVIL